MTRDYEVVIVGSGINALVCAAELALKGRRVLVLERNPVAGGCMATQEATLPGFHHDLFAMSLPLFVTAPHFERLSGPLKTAGLTLLNPALPTAVLRPDGTALVLSQSRDTNIATFDAAHPGDGAAYARAMASIEADAELIFGLLGHEPSGGAALGLLARTLRRRKASGVARFAGAALSPMRAWLETEFKSDLSRALIAPWILHTGLNPDAPMSALMGKLILFTLEVAGVPIVQGGIANLVTAFRSIIEQAGGRVETDADVTQVVVARGKATGVQIGDGRFVAAERAVVCNVTPTQLYDRLLGSADVSQAVRQDAAAYRYGRAGMQIHVALSEAPRWKDERLGGVGLVHLTAGLNAVSKAVNEADRGLLPEAPTIVVGQPAATDPSRCPPGQSMLWIQLLELPKIVTGDAAGLIDIPADGRWSDAVRDAYVRRVLGTLGQHIENLDSATLAVTAYSPADLEAHNINLVGGDPYSGACSVDQFHGLRPFGATRNHTTPVKRLYQIGAATHPGPGLGGMSGHMLAQRL